MFNRNFNNVLTFIGKDNKIIGTLNLNASVEEIDIMIKRTFASFYNLYLKKSNDRILLTGPTYQFDLNDYFQYTESSGIEFSIQNISNNYILKAEISSDNLLLVPTSVKGFSFISVIAKVPDKDIFIETVLEVINPTELYEDFEIADLESSQISWTHSGEAQWSITEGQAFMKDRSLRSGDIGPWQESEIKLELDLQEPGTLIFAYKTSIRPYYDKLNFYIDDLNVSEIESPDLWTGNNDWRLMSFNIRAGKRSFRWVYNRTSATSYYYDYAAWIDMVVIPDKLDPLSGIDNETSLIKEISLNAYPNPFNPNTTINFQIHERDIAELLIFDIKGRQVTEIFKGQLDKGTHSFEFDGSRLSSGIYYSVLKYGDKFLTNKLILAK
ncbi:MAG: T9SS type A sorting domain-containing protein [Candidatus Delongbacteria bacterium]|nr:T9SS type A sorting domain-containing protein [Candidatus Delongbacteria bacterium]